MRHYIYYNFDDYAGFYTTDTELMNALRNEKSLTVWYEVSEKNGKLVGKAFLTTEPTEMPVLKRKVAKWKKFVTSAPSKSKVRLSQ